MELEREIQALGLPQAWTAQGSNSQPHARARQMRINRRLDERSGFPPQPTRGSGHPNGKTFSTHFFREICAPSHKLSTLQGHGDNSDKFPRCLFDKEPNGDQRAMSALSLFGDYPSGAQCVTGPFPGE